ncbi:MAG: rhodanese-like domain-containing protein [Actinomycetota bacterium]
MLAQTASDRRTGLDIVDVRAPDEWAAGHIEGSRNIPLQELAARAEELAADRPVVAVCRTGRRSARAIETLRSLGFEADHLEGGVTAWSDLDLPLVTPDGRPGVVLPPGGTLQGPSHEEHDHQDHDHDHEHEHDHHEHHHGHVHDEHCDHDHEGALGEAAVGRVMELLSAVQEHFGDREPTEAEVRAFFEQRLASEGLSPEEIRTLLS